MATREQLVQAGLLTVTFVAVIALLVALQLTFGPPGGALIEPTFVVVAFVPFLIYLGVTGRLERFSGGGFELRLREQADKTVTPQRTDDTIEVTPEETQQKGSLAALVDRETPPTALSFRTGAENIYAPSVIYQYLETLGDNPDFRYIVFTDSVGGFEGYMHANEFEYLFETTEVTDELESGVILTRDGVITASVSSESTNRETLRKMDQRNISELAVVDSANQFVGVITQDEIVRKLLSSAVRAVQ
jgi:hypothetical protein